MLTREKELRRSSATQRAYTLRLTDSVTVTREIQIRVVREFGLPDEAVEVFDSQQHEGRGGMDMDHDLEVFGRLWNEPPDLMHQQIEQTATQVRLGFLSRDEGAGSSYSREGGRGNVHMDHDFEVFDASTVLTNR